ncbi:MAG: alpha-ketoglutarate-dependent dioxygenase AlkB [Chloroflexi bacterium]|nr:alpha-ketoglutarate-dependent dioxygenase AlkB [Chloroflexota bacterium]
MQLDLFGQSSAVTETSKSNLINLIPGLRYVEHYIGVAEHDALLRCIDAQSWITDLKRRVQHYGYQYDYKARKIAKDMQLGNLPTWLQTVACRLHQDGYISTVPDQVIVNEYEPGQGIASHIDCEPCFDNIIISLSLGSGCIMNLTHKIEKTKVPIWLAPGSIVVLQGEARYEWLHGISPRKTDEQDGRKLERKRRVSLTFRKVVL